MLLNLQRQSCHGEDLGIGQHRRIGRRDRQLHALVTIGTRYDRVGLIAGMGGDDRRPSGIQYVGIRGYRARHHHLALAVRRLDHDAVATPGRGIGGEGDARGASGHHLLYDHRHLGGIGHVATGAVGENSRGEQRGPAIPHRRNQIAVAANVGAGDVHAREGGGRAVLADR